MYNIQPFPYSVMHPIKMLHVFSEIWTMVMLLLDEIEEKAFGTRHLQYMELEMTTAGMWIDLGWMP